MRHPRCQGTGQRIRGPGRRALRRARRENRTGEDVDRFKGRGDMQPCHYLRVPNHRHTRQQHARRLERRSHPRQDFYRMDLLRAIAHRHPTVPTWLRGVQIRCPTTLRTDLSK